MNAERRPVCAAAENIFIRAPEVSLENIRLIIILHLCLLIPGNAKCVPCGVDGYIRGEGVTGVVLIGFEGLLEFVFGDVQAD